MTNFIKNRLLGKVKEKNFQHNKKRQKINWETYQKKKLPYKKKKKNL